MYALTLLNEVEGSLLKRGDHLSVHYEAKLMNGTVIDSSRDRDKPFLFILGKS